MQFLAGTLDHLRRHARPDNRRPPLPAGTTSTRSTPPPTTLRASGAPGDYYHAIYVYNHAGWYVAEVEQWAAKYRAAGATIAPAGSGTDPIPGFTIGRDDMGVDASAPVGTPIYAPADSQLVQVLNDWYQGQPLLLFRFLSPPAGALSPYWYVAEQITPVSITIGTIFRARAAVARYAPCCTGIEIGWGSPTSTQRTLAGETDPGCGAIRRLARRQPGARASSDSSASPRTMNALPDQPTPDRADHAQVAVAPAPSDTSPPAARRAALAFTEPGGPVVVVCGLHGGAGTSTLALLLAHYAAAASSVPVLLCEAPGASGNQLALGAPESAVSLDALAVTLAMRRASAGWLVGRAREPAGARDPACRAASRTGRRRPVRHASGRRPRARPRRSLMAAAFAITAPASFSGAPRT